MAVTEEQKTKLQNAEKIIQGNKLTPGLGQIDNKIFGLRMKLMGAGFGQNENEQQALSILQSASDALRHTKEDLKKGEAEPAETPAQKLAQAQRLACAEGLINQRAPVVEFTGAENFTPKGHLPPVCAAVMKRGEEAEQKKLQHQNHVKFTWSFKKQETLRCIKSETKVPLRVINNYGFTSPHHRLPPRLRG